MTAPCTVFLCVVSYPFVIIYNCCYNICNDQMVTNLFKFYVCRCTAAVLHSIYFESFHSTVFESEQLMLQKNDLHEIYLVFILSQFIG